MSDQTKSVDWLFIILVYNVEKTYENRLDWISIEKEKCLIIESIENAYYNIDKTAAILVEAKRPCAEKPKLTTTFKTKNADGKLISFLPDIESEAQMLTKQSLKDILEKITAVYKFKNNIVLSLGHGSVFGVNFTRVPPLSLPQVLTANNDNNTAENTKDNQCENIIKGVNEVEEFFSEQYLHIDSVFTKALFYGPVYLEKPLNKAEGYYLLSTVEMNEAFAEVFSYKNKALDILAFSHCFMQNIFTQYHLYRSVDYLVAPISGISYPGYNIAAILSYLDTATSVKDAARYFVDSNAIRKHKCYEEKLAKEAIENRWFIQCIQLNPIIFGGFKDAFKTLLDNLYILLNDTINKNVIKTFFNSLIFNGYKYSEKSLPSLDLIDFNVFCKAFRLDLKRYHSGNEVLQKIVPCLEEVIKLLDSIPIDYFIGDNFLQNPNNFNDYMYKADIERKIAFGIYFPKDYILKPNLMQMISEHNKYSPALLNNTRYESILTILSS